MSKSNLTLALVLGLLVGSHLRLIDLGKRLDHTERVRVAQMDALIELKKKTSELELQQLAQTELISQLRISRPR